MSDSEQYHKITCPSCGAPIRPEGDQAECPFCGTVVQRSEPSVPFVRVEVGRSISARPAVRQAGLGVGVIVAIALSLLALGGFIAWFSVSPQRPSARVISLRGSPFLVPVDREGPADVLAITYDVKNDSNSLTYFDSAERTARWEGPTLSEDSYRAPIAVGGSRVYVVDQAELLALSLDDGTLAWQAPLADTASSSCEGCLRFLDNYVAVLSEDGTLQAFEASTGRPAWSFRLNETPRRLHVLDGHLGAFDLADPEDWRSLSLFLWEPATGDLVRRIPVHCVEGRHTDTPGTDVPVLVDRSGKQIYLLYGLSPGCAQKWDLDRGVLIWQITVEYYLDQHHSTTILQGDMIYTGIAGVVLAMDTADGELRQLTAEDDYELIPLAVQENTLVVAARRTRGSERYELWGLDPTSGARRWQIILEEEDLLGNPGAWADPAWAAHLTREGLTLLHLLTEPPRLTVETIDPQTGTSLGQVTSDLDDEYWQEAIWTNDTVWLLMRKLHAVDLSTGEVLFSWP